MKAGEHTSIKLAGRKVEYRVVRSKAARKLRVRVGPNGVEVLQPAEREDGDVTAFLRANDEWISAQLSRVARLNGVRKPDCRHAGELLYRGVLTSVRVKTDDRRRGGNCAAFEKGCIYTTCGRRTPPARTLENWLRRQARAEIERHVGAVTKRLRRSPGRLYIMDQRTKWGNCSAMQNLSFNWRVILAPDFVLRYLVTHESVHLAVPDHSSRFWLTVQSLCPDTEKAKQWLCANGQKLLLDLSQVCHCGDQEKRDREGREGGLPGSRGDG
jgi:predicted metal-dependent hydrolase